MPIKFSFQPWPIFLAMVSIHVAKFTLVTKPFTVMTLDLFSMSALISSMVDVDKGWGVLYQLRVIFIHGMSHSIQVLFLHFFYFTFHVI